MPLRNYEERIRIKKKEIKENDTILEKNKGLIKDFDRHLQLNDFSNARRYKYLCKLPKMAEILDRSFEEAEKRDIEDIVLSLKNREDLTETTKGDYQVLLKRFMKWVNDGDYPESVEWINTTNKAENGKLPEDMLTEEDIEELIDHAMNPRDRALISVLWETGARIGELIDLTIGSLEDHKHGYKIIVDGKTGSRRLPLIESVPYIQAWLQSHPDRGNREAPLWVNIGTRNKGQPMRYGAIRKILKDIKKRTDLEKPVNPHIFRHSRATYLANRFTEAQLCEWFGWVQGSDVPAKYVHLSGRDIDSSYARLHGIEEEEDQEVSKMAPEDCPRCEAKVSPNSDFCHRCGQALSVEAMKEVEEDQEDFRKVFAQIGQMKPELLDDMQEFLDIIKIMRENKDVLEKFKRLEKKEKD